MTPRDTEHLALSLVGQSPFLQGDVLPYVEEVLNGVADVRDVWQIDGMPEADGVVVIPRRVWALAVSVVLQTCPGYAWAADRGAS